ncbi:MAG: imelysin family protein [Pseudomonadota bacterium]
MAFAGNSPSVSDVLNHYSDIALAGYTDSLSTARDLDAAIDALIANPSASTLDAARASWLDSRVPYQQTEVYRFGNVIVDDWEGKVNAWPLDEGLIDYVDASYGSESDENLLYTANVVANTKLMLSGKEIDVSNISPALLADSLHEVDGVEANVATGYHAIEFLLWGQDLNGTESGAGERPASDFDTANCTGGNCERRAAYLKAASELLISDLEWIVAQWEDDGDARKSLLDGSEQAGLSAIITGMGSLSYGELAGERMKLGLILHDPEEEHDCFSDNTHHSHFYDALGVQNVYTGRYERVDGRVLTGPSLSDLVANKDSGIDSMLQDKLADTVDKMGVIVASAVEGESYDQLIGSGNDAGNAKVQAAIDALVAQTRVIEQAAAALGVEEFAIEGSDSLDNPSAVEG